MARSSLALAIVRSLCLTIALSMALHPSVAASASSGPDRGPKIGAAIPHTLKAVDQSGQHQDFKSLARRRGLIILFSRSYDW